MGGAGATDATHAADDLARGRALMRCNSLVARFCAYGLLKNLKFFEPFLVVVLTKWGLSLAAIGGLVSVEKFTCYVAELPSGYAADRFGARRTLCACFLLYILSFVCYYFGQTHIAVLVAASFFYGLAEAARSGAHKSMVFLWLEKHDLLSLKSYLNGKTRSFSLLGSALAAVGGIFFTLYLDADETIFLCSIPPYVVDLAVVASYPAYMDTRRQDDNDTSNPDSKNKKKKKKKKKKRTSMCHDAKSLLAALKRPNARRAVFSTALMGVFHRLFKDYIQPVVQQNGKSMFGEDRWDKTSQTVTLGVLYCCFYLCSAPATRNAYRLPGCGCGCSRQGKRVMDALFDVYSLVLIVAGGFLFAGGPASLGVLGLTLGLYISYNCHKPLSAAAISDVAGKHLRATVMSGDALLQTLIVSMLAPLAGFLADQVSLAVLYTAFGGAALLINRTFAAEWSLCNRGSGGGDTGGGGGGGGPGELTDSSGGGSKEPAAKAQAVEVVAL